VCTVISAIPRIEVCAGSAAETCEGLEVSYEQYYAQYMQIAIGGSMQESTTLYTPYCIEWGVIPLTPKTIEVQFQQAFQDEISLEAGWNFFSVPYELAVSKDQWSELGLDSKCTASAMWNDNTQTFTTPIPAGTVLKPLEGYWCKSATKQTITVQKLNTGNGVILPLVKTVYPGWNDVAIASPVAMKIEHALISVDSAYATVLDWLENLQRFASFANTGELGGGAVPGTTGTNEMKAGQGYFIWSTLPTGQTETLAGQS
jgi:hypothetical protein